MQLHVFHWSTKLLLQDAICVVRDTNGSMLGLWVRLSRFLPHLVLHSNAAQADYRLRQHSQVHGSDARRLPRSVLWDMRPSLQQDRRQKRVIRQRRCRIATHEQPDYFPQFIISAVLINLPSEINENTFSNICFACCPTHQQYCVISTS